MDSVKEGEKYTVDKYEHEYAFYKDCVWLEGQEWCWQKAHTIFVPLEDWSHAQHMINELVEEALIPVELWPH